MTKEIQLTQDKVALVDDEDFEYINQFKWCAKPNYKSYVAVRTVYIGGGRKKQKNKVVYMHRVIMNSPNNLMVDHINHDTLDNRKQNLRNVTSSQNQMNRIVSSRNVLGFMGVSKHQGGYRARILALGKQMHFPVRDTLEEAINDRKEAEEKYFGDFSMKR